MAETQKEKTLWYWDTFVRALTTYQGMSSTTGVTGSDKKIKLLEIMNGSLIGFIEENFRNPEPLLSQELFTNGIESLIQKPTPEKEDKNGQEVHDPEGTEGHPV